MRELHISEMTPPALAIAIALHEKALPFTIVDVDWRGIPAAMAPFSSHIELAHSLEGEFPILIENGVALSDSFLVLEYLDERYPSPPLRPASAYGQWRVQGWSRFLAERAAPAVATLGSANFFEGQRALTIAAKGFSDSILSDDRRGVWKAALTQGPTPALREESHRKLGLLLGKVEDALATGPWLLGDDYSIIDIAAFSLVVPIASGAVPEVALDNRPRTRAWLDAVAARQAVRAALDGRTLAVLPGPEHARWG